MTAPATDIITRLIGYAEHDADCAKSKMNSNIIPCTCGYSAAIADAREFLEGESDEREIKPCPFCGTSMVVVTNDMFFHPGTLGDSQCLMAGKGYYWEHIDWWNTRPINVHAARRE